MLTLTLVRNPCDGEDLHVGAGGLLQRLFDAAMRDHFTSDLREARESVGDRQESILVQEGKIAGDVPAIVQGLGRQILPPQVPLHDVRALDQQHTRRVGWQGGEGVGIDDLYRHARQWLADGAAP